MQQRGWTWRILCLSKTEKDKYRMLSLLCGIKKIKKNNEYNKTKTDSQVQRTNLWLPVGKIGVGD